VPAHELDVVIYTSLSLAAW